MTMKKFLNYCRYSNIQLALDLNPLTWGFKCYYTGPDDLDPGMYYLTFKFICVRMTFLFDDGSW